MEETQNKIVPLAVGILFVVLIIATLITGYVYFKKRSQNNLAKTKVQTQQVQGVEDTAIINTTRSNDLLAQQSSTSVTPAAGQQVNFNTNGNVNTAQEKGGTTTSEKPTQIPKTGIGIIFLPAVFSGLFAGVYIKRRT